MRKLIFSICLISITGLIKAQSSSHNANTLLISNSDNCSFGWLTNTSGTGNVAVGWHAMRFNSSGFYNTASGANALLQNIGGYYNTATGSAAMENNTYGYFNTATGLHALWSNTTGNQNTSHGMQSSFSNTTGSNNVAAGYQALYSNTVGNYIVADGFQSLYNNTADNNVATGAFSLFSNTSGIDNVGIGYNSLFSMNTGNSNTAGGNGSGYGATGQLNAFLGYNAGYGGGGSGMNTMIGAEAGYNTTFGDENVFVGWRSAYNNVFGVHNTFVGNISGMANTSGSNNTFIGIGTGGANSTGQNNSSLGAGSGMASANLANATAIGSGALVTTSNSMILGDNSVNVGIGLSNTTPGPQNKLEINTPAGSPIPGASGLRFRDLTSASTPQTSNGKVLSVDANGDVIIVQGSASLGNACPSSTNPLTTSWNIPLNTNDFYFTDDNPQKDKVHVGYSCTQGPGKFNVITNVESNPSNPWESYSIHGLNTFNTLAGASTWGTGVYGEATAMLGSTFEKGVWGVASGTREAIGVKGEALVSFANGYGGYFSSMNGGPSNNFGVYAEAKGGNLNYGIYATVFGTSYLGGGPDWAGYFDGDVFTTTGYFPSDRNLKKDVRTIETSLDIINKLNPVTYKFDVESHKSINLPSVQQYGFISQEVEQLLPELTKKAIYPAKYDEKGKVISEEKEILSLNYTGFIAILAKGIQEQQTIIDQQAKTNESLQTQIDELKELFQSLSVNGTNPNTQSISLSDKNTIVLNQNVPNPFAESTVITYNIPSSFGRAQIIFSNMNGEVMKVMNITSTGEGRLNVFADDLTSGIYTYSLVVDGKTIDTKKMVKQ